MDKSSLENLLCQIGLSEREAKVYLMSLSIGPSSILALSKKTGVNRTTLYGVVDALTQEGLMSTVQQGFKKLYAPEPPGQLINLLDKKRNALNKGIEELQTLYDARGRDSFIRTRFGLNAFKAAYESTLERVPHKAYFYVIGNTSLLLSLDPQYFKSYFARRSRLYSDIRLFLRDSDIVQQYKKQEALYNFKIKLLPAEISINSVLIVTPKKLLISQMLPPYETLEIENPSVIDFITAVFRAFWEVQDDFS